MLHATRVRLALTNACVVMIVIAVLAILGYRAIAAGLDASTTEELRVIARREAGTIERAGGEVPPATAVDLADATLSIGIFDAAGDSLGGGFNPPPWLTPSEIAIRDIDVQGTPVRIVTAVAIVDGRVVARVAAARSLAPQRRILSDARGLVGAGSALGIVLSLSAGWWLAGRALRPMVRSYEAQSLFAANASHELRSPLTFIRAGVEELATKDPDLGAQVLGEVDYLTGLTEQMLRLARAERLSGDLAATSFDLDDACRAAANRGRAAADVHLDLVGSPLRVQGDRVATEAILDVLIENVGRHGGGSATLRWRADRDRAIVEVSDRGPGLPRAMQEAVLDRFVRPDGSRTRSTGGAGLGLAIARALAKAQGGSLRLGETEGGGLTVTFDLPVARS